MVDEHLISLQPGTVINGRYEVVKCLGAGSMGLVYACRHRELSGHMVAVKVLFPEVAQDKIAAARFRNEIFASYGVSHPNVVRAYEFLRDGDLLAYTMEFVGGGDLADRLSTNPGGLPINDVLGILSEMCAGVQAIHDAGIVHRDLKPENILLTKDGHVKIADFGIARTGHGPKLTEHGGVVGTIDYVSPEYMLNSQVDWRSDIYAIGILAYEMVTGESPFRGDSVYATMTMRLKADPTTPSALRPECPPELDRIILHAMQRDPEVRYQSTAAMFQDLQALMTARGVQTAAPIQAPRPVTAAYVGPAVAPTPQAPPAPPPVQEPVRVSRPISPAPTPLVSQPRPAVEQSPAPVSPRADLWSQPVGRSAQESKPRKEFQSAVPARNVRSEDNFQEQSRMEQVLAFPDFAPNSWQPKSPGADERTTPTETNDRLERLAVMAQKTQRSVWVDIFTLVVAVILGVGLGFMALRTLFPEVIQPPITTGSNLQEHNYASGPTSWRVG